MKKKGRKCRDIRTKNRSGESAKDSQTKSILLERVPWHFFRRPKGPRSRERAYRLRNTIYFSFYLRSKRTRRTTTASLASPATPTATNNSRYNFSPLARIIQTFFILSFSGWVDPRRSLRRIYHPRLRCRRRLFPSTSASVVGRY